jgi:hypothetical protein
MYDNCFKDKRLDKRANKIMKSMIDKKTAILHQLSNDYSEQMGSYRFFNNDSIETKELKDAIYSKCSTNSKNKHVLCIQDTTEINYSRLVGKLKHSDNNIGPVGNDRDPGFFLHANIVLDSEDMFPTGISSLIEWNRSWNKLDKYQREYKKLPITEKESYRWIKSIETSKEVLKDSASITVIGDRESDIYEELVYVPDKNIDLLIRSSINRKLFNTDVKLFEYLDSSKIQGQYTLEIKGNKKRIDRLASLSIKFTKVKIKRPYKSVNKTLPDFVEMWAIESRELDSSVPKNEEPILWRIITTHQINSIEDAYTYVKWYAMRWQIEQFFRVLKSKGLDIESSQLSDGNALKRLLIFSTQAALNVLQLTLARDGNTNQKAELIFENQELEFMEKMAHTLEGKTMKQQNLFMTKTLPWASWVIARLGGWKGYKSQSPPGPITMLNGLDKFFQQYSGWKCAIEFMKLQEKDVYRE